jgi:glycerol-3-phosphate dehydrogenase
MEAETVQNRLGLVNRLATQKEWDLIVIGGGATGLGIALEAVSRGYSA